MANNITKLNGDISEQFSTCVPIPQSSYWFRSVIQRAHRVQNKHSLRALGTLKKAQVCLPLITHKLLHRSLELPYLEYCSSYVFQTDVQDRKGSEQGNERLSLVGHQT